MFVYLINRLPTPILDHQSPHLKLYGKIQDYICLPTFGCACFPLFCAYTSHKLMFHSKHCIFLSYSVT